MQTSKQQFGDFLVELRKQNNLTQKQLAEKLHISDKSVSKWEKGRSLPDVSLILPLAEVLGVSATELLQGERIEQNKTFSQPQVEAIIKKVVDFSDIKNISKQKEPIKKTIKTTILLNIISALTVFIPFIFCFIVFNDRSFVLSFIPINKVGPVANFTATVGIFINISFVALVVVFSLKRSFLYLFSMVNIFVAIVFLNRYCLMLGYLTSLETAIIIVRSEFIYYLIALAISIAIIVFGFLRQKTR